MSVSIVFTFIGTDKPGMIRQLSEMVTDHGGNWLESRMNKLAGQFAGIVRVQVDAERAEALVDALTALSGQGLAVNVHTEPGEPAAETLRQVHLDLIGYDHPGIVQELSRELVRQGINICEMNTNLTSAPMTGEALFTATAEIQVPADTDLLQLNEILDRVANELAVDIALRD